MKIKILDSSIAHVLDKQMIFAYPTEKIWNPNGISLQKRLKSKSQLRKLIDDAINPANLKKLNAAPLNREGRRVALGLGTGLGMKDGVLFPDENFWLGKNEIGQAGHVLQIA